MNIKKITWIAIAIFSIVFLILFAFSIQRNNGEFVYPIDDTYIHMAIANNTADYGMWGIDKYSFSATSSSLLYGGLLTAIFLLIDHSLFIPLGFNIVCALLIFLQFNAIATKNNTPIYLYAFYTAMLLLFVPLPTMAFSGMEHLMHALIAIGFIYLASRMLSGEEGSLGLLLFFSILIGSVRYEGLFLVGIIPFLFVLQRKYGVATFIFITGMLPMILFGIVSVSNGSHFLPNTILIKSDASSLSNGALVNFIINTLDNLVYHITRLYLTVPILITGIIAYRTRNHKSLIFYASAITFLLLISHCAFAKVGRYNRYESYLIATSIFAYMLGHDVFKAFIRQYFKSKIAITIVVIILLAPWIKRSYRNYHRTIQATHNIYDQQIQMSRLLSSLPDNITVMANDIGAISYFNPNIHIVDMVGLGSIDVLNMLRNSTSSEEKREGYSEIAKNNESDLAVIYDHWYPNEVPKGWRKIETWTIQNNVICGHETVSFYAINTNMDDILKKELANHNLPKDVIRNK
ncbi:hypothetical protein [Fulvivirga sp.]|uniref:hypothetical protein n=2 Tax=Fulvivirga sp. TaxID=1931237 RepID=UPI0032EFD0D3